MSKLHLHDLLRAHAVKRFHMVNTTRIQNNAEHQYGVAVLAGEIGGRLGLRAPVVATLIAAAIVHDAGEARTGDIPSMTKKRLREKLGKGVDEVLDRFDPPKPKDNFHKRILKCADLLEAMIFLDEHKVGKHAGVAFEWLKSEAFRYFDMAGDPGVVAYAIWNEIQAANYEI